MTKANIPIMTTNLTYNNYYSKYMPKKLPENVTTFCLLRVSFFKVLLDNHSSLTFNSQFEWNYFLANSIWQSTPDFSYV